MIENLTEYLKNNDANNVRDSQCVLFAIALCKAARKIVHIIIFIVVWLLNNCRAIRAIMYVSVSACPK